MGRSRVRRYGAAAAMCGAVMVFASGCAVFSQDPEQETILIGVDLELTGADAALGTIYHEALQLRVEQVNQQELLGNRRLELLVLDNRSDAATASTNLAELAGNPDVRAVVTGGCDECVIGAVETINDAGLPVIALAAASELTEPLDERQFLFQLAPPAVDIARVLAEDMERIGARTVGLVATEDLYGTEGGREMATAANRAGLEVVVTEPVTAEEDSVAAAASAILAYQPVVDPLQQPPAEQSPGPDAVVMWAPEEIIGQLATRLRDQGYEGRFFLDSSAANELFLDGALSEALNGSRMVFTETMVIDGVVATSPAKAARQNWFNAYTARQGTYHAYSSFAADAVEVIVAAINRFDRTDRESLRTALENTQVDGFSGPIRFRLTTHSGLNPQALVSLVAQGDRWRLATG